jgi:integrase
MTFKIPSGKSKSKKILNIQLPPLVMALLEQRRDSPDADETFVFPSPRKAGQHLDDVKSSWARIVVRAQLENIRPHDCRRSSGSWMTIGGSSISIVAGALGHASLKSAEVYSRLSSDPIRNSVINAVNVMFKSAPAALLLPPVKDDLHE